MPKSRDTQMQGMLTVMTKRISDIFALYKTFIEKARHCKHLLASVLNKT